MNINKHHIGLGTAAIGRPQYINIKQEESEDFSLKTFKEKGRLMLDIAYQKGIRYFDTAPGYGMAEQLLIDWISEKQYKDVEIATKWGYTYVANFKSNAIIHEVKEHSLAKLNEQWEQSKALLPYLTTYQIHSATLDSGVLDNKEILDRLSEMKQKYGLLMGLTTSGSNQEHMIRKSLDIESNGEALFDVFQVTYNLLDQSLDQIAKELVANKKRVVIKEALANGRIFPNPNYPQYNLLYQELKKLANKYNVGIDAIAIRFCVDSLEPYKVLSGASSNMQITENLEALNLKLEEDELDILKRFSIKSEQYWTERKRLGWN